MHVNDLVSLLLTSTKGKPLVGDSTFQSAMLDIVALLGCEALVWKIDDVILDFAPSFFDGQILDEMRKQIGSEKVILSAAFSENIVRHEFHLLHEEAPAVLVACYSPIRRNLQDDISVRRFEIGLQNVALPLLARFLSHRHERLSFLPPKHLVYGWNKGDSARQILWPWKQGASVEVATLAIDMRKSTFCMEECRMQSDFAQFLEDFEKLARSSARKHGAVFDKFTGDGVLLHFVADQFEEINMTKLSESLMECVIDISIQATDLLLNLTENMRMLRKGLGFGFGVDEYSTLLKVGTNNEIFAVGSGIVRACRLCDSSEAGKLRVSNTFAVRLQRECPWLQNAGESMPFSTKEYPEIHQVTVFEIDIAQAKKLKLTTSHGQ